MTFEERWVTAGARRMFARAGPTVPGRDAVVLVHGFIIAGGVYEHVAPLLANDFNVFVPDLPGYGRSEQPPRPLDVPALADAMVAWMDAVGLGRALLVGNSLGSQVVADLAARYPQRIVRIVLQGPTVPKHERSMLIQAFRRRQNERRESSQALHELSRRDYRVVGFSRALRIGRMILRDRIEEKLPRIAVPALLVRGTRDPIVRGGWLERLAGLLADGRIAEVAGGTHSVVFIEPERFVAAIRPFLLEARA